MRLTTDSPTPCTAAPSPARGGEAHDLDLVHAAVLMVEDPPLLLDDRAALREPADLLPPVGGVGAGAASARGMLGTLGRLVAAPELVDPVLRQLVGLLLDGLREEDADADLAPVLLVVLAAQVEVDALVAFRVHLLLDEALGLQDLQPVVLVDERRRLRAAAEPGAAVRRALRVEDREALRDGRELRGERGVAGRRVEEELVAAHTVEDDENDAEGLLALDHREPAAAAARDPERAAEPLLVLRLVVRDERVEARARLGGAEVGDAEADRRLPAALLGREPRREPLPRVGLLESLRRAEEEVEGRDRGADDDAVLLGLDEDLLEGPRGR